VELRHLGLVEPCPIRPRHPQRMAAETMLEVVAARDLEIGALHAALGGADELQQRITRIESSRAARVYRRMMRIPGVRGLLLGRSRA
ncbi:MAG: hypothetical protein ACREQ5_37010, partial [Candidatus Dormibacteria bacterium]